MGRKNFYALLGTEVTVENTVADFSMMIVDSKGIIFNSCRVLVKDHYNKHELFHDANHAAGRADVLKEQKRTYKKLLSSGGRMLVSTNAINNWIRLAYLKYTPELTAFNLQCDIEKCKNTGINFSNYLSRFSLGQAMQGNICSTPAFKRFFFEKKCSEVKNLNDFESINWAELVASFLAGREKERKFTAYEYLEDFDLPILIDVLRRKKWRRKVDYFEAEKSVN